MSRIEFGGFSNGSAFPHVERSVGSCCDMGVSVGVVVIGKCLGCREVASTFVNATSRRMIRMSVWV